MDLSKHGVKLDKVTFEIITRDGTSLKTFVVPDIGVWITDKLLIPVMRNWRRLCVIDLRNCDKLSNMSVDVLAATCSQLTSINLSGCGWVHGSSFAKLVSNNEHLRSVYIRKCKSLDDTAVELMAKCLQHLELLDISEISNLSDSSLHAIGKHSHNLKYLRVVGCWRMTDTGITILGEYCSELRALDCSHCRDITERALHGLKRNGVIVDDGRTRFERLSSLPNQSELSFPSPIYHSIHPNV